jgi:hypothetical protein
VLYRKRNQKKKYKLETKTLVKNKFNKKFCNKREIDPKTNLYKRTNHHSKAIKTHLYFKKKRIQKNRPNKIYKIKKM